MKGEAFYPGDFSLLEGRREYTFDCPDGDQQLDVIVMGDCPVVVYLIHGDRKLPVDVGLHVRRRFYTTGVTAVVLRPVQEGGVLTAQVGSRPRKMFDKTVGQAVELLPQASRTVPLEALVGRTIGDNLKDLIGDEDAEVDLDELEDDAELDFGEGHMETDDEDAFAVAERSEPEAFRSKPKAAAGPGAGKPGSPGPGVVQRPVPDGPAGEADGGTGGPGSVGDDPPDQGATVTK